MTGDPGHPDSFEFLRDRKVPISDRAGGAPRQIRCRGRTRRTPPSKVVAENPHACWYTTYNGDGALEAARNRTRMAATPAKATGCGNLRGDLERWVSDVATDLSDPDALALMRATIGAVPDGGCACVADRHAQLAAMLERAQARDGHAPDVDQAADALLGPLYYRALFTIAPAKPSWARDLVGDFLG